GILLQVLEFRRGDPVLVLGDADSGQAHPYLHQLLGFFIRQRLEHYSINNAEDGRVGADAKRQRQYGDGSKPWAAANNAQRISNVLEKAFHDDSFAQKAIGIYTKATRFGFLNFLYATTA